MRWVLLLAQKSRWGNKGIESINNFIAQVTESVSGRENINLNFDLKTRLLIIKLKFLPDFWGIDVIWCLLPKRVK